MEHIDRVDVRERLAPRRDAYYKRVSEGRYIGFRKPERGSKGTWLARFYEGGRTYRHKALGDFAAMEERQRYDAAVKAADEWFRHLDQGGTSDKDTVKGACEAYAARLRGEKGEEAARNAEGTFRRLLWGNGKKIGPDPIARIELEKLRPSHMQAWRERVLKRGSKSYFNRNLTPLRAALNLALDNRKVASDFAWSKALRPLKLDGRQGRRTIYLDIDQRRSLIEKASDEFRPLVIAWTLLPVRPGDIPRCRVQHLDVRHRVIHVPSGKTGSRDVPLPDEAIEHFKACTKGKTPGAWLVGKVDGSQWDRFSWRDAMWDAVQKAELPHATVAYCIRHSVITDLVVGGLDIFTVAKLSGTSVAMIDKHYGHLRADHARQALAKLSLK